MSCRVYDETNMIHGEEGYVKVEPISNGNLRIWLSQEELDDSHDMGNTRRCLRQVLQAAQTRLGRLGKHIFAELIPVAGGWVLLLSARINPSVTGPSVYRIADIRTLYRLAEHWAAIPTQAPMNGYTCLYETDNGYDLAVYRSPRLDGQRAALLRQFGTLIGRGEAAAACAAEHGRLLASGDALGQLLFTERERRLREPSDREN